MTWHTIWLWGIIGINMILPLQSEIHEVSVTWVGIECQTSCMNGLKKQFQAIPGVAEVSMSSGMALLKWKPNATFNYSSINTAMRMIGLNMQTTRVKATGKIQSTKNTIYLISSGDGTRFELANPVHYNPSGQSSEHNLGARYLSPELKQKLLDAEAQKQIVTISGPLFMPIRMIPNNVLVVEQIHITSPSK